MVHPVVELASDVDMDKVLELLQKSFLSVQRAETVKRDIRFWNWKYRSSPFGPAFIQVIRHDGDIVATGCLLPMNLLVKGRPLSAFQTCDIAVHPDFRRRGFLKKVLDARKLLALEKGGDLLFSFPNANSLPGYIKSGWEYVGRVPWLVQVTKPMAVVRDRLYPGKSQAMAVPTKYQLRESMMADVPAHSAGVQDSISLERPPDYWRWRFSEHPNRQYGLVRSSTDANSIAIFTLSCKPSGLIEMVIVDLVCEPASLPDLLRAILKCAQRVGAGFIALMKPRGLPIGTFYRRAFVPVRQKNFAVLPLVADLPDRIADIKHWNFRAAMHDSI